MKKYFKIGLVAIIWITLSGCNSNTASHALSDAIDKALVVTSGNKPASRFHFTGPEYINRWYFSNKNYKMNAPTTYQKDWVKMSGWRGVEDFQGAELILYFKDALEYGDLLSYAINVSSSVGEYGERAKAIETRDKSYIENVRKKYQYSKNSKTYYETHGKENYPCIVNEVINPKTLVPGTITQSYGCYKFNTIRNKYKSVSITLTYTKSPNLPEKYKHLAKEYTYKDLQKRAKRMLDSLYIKDEW
ncbi:hypothetical protein [Sulfurovum sp. TSL1]|uniref:hypothetical protein n=1 Tax=Sulfurovum sp. TSL1 TaxID=2826994 RepID=UPI001CC41F5E|nr:hypothetical protein [Sulfurovum sp. TSL1]GIT98147.1 hypothetical protein TSL1_09680 [Sulfurovum sp. TSL1]